MHQRRDRALLCILMLAFAVRAAAVLALGSRDPGPDALNDYLPIAANVLEGRGFINAAGEPDYVRGPGYPLFIAAVQAVAGPDRLSAILWMQALLDTCTAALAATIARRTLGDSAARWTALLYAFNPLAAYASALIGPETLFAFLLTASLAAFQGAIATRRPVWVGVAGVLMGYCVLTRATPLLLVPVWGAWLVVALRTTTSEAITLWKSLRTGLAFAVVLGVTSAAVVLPWTWRNWRVFHEFIPVVANGGSNLYAGSSERFWPAPPEHHEQRDLRERELIQAGAVEPPPAAWHGPAEGDAYMLSLGRANYRLAWQEDPAGLVTYLARKSLRLWYATQSGRQERFVGLINVALLCLAVAGFGVAVCRRQLWTLVPVGLAIAYFPAVLIAMFPLARYVVGFAPCLCVFGAAACVAAQEAVTAWLANRGTGFLPARVELGSGR
jgi:4-amino-4-deoxy-L-arabinose transferase-like glycosyltransferase